MRRSIPSATLASSAPPADAAYFERLRAQAERDVQQALNWYLLEAGA